MMFMLPLVVAIFGTGYFIFATDESWKWKGLSAGLLVVSIALQWVPALQTHFLVPLLLQAVLAIWMAIYWKVHQ